MRDSGLSALLDGVSVALAGSPLPTLLPEECACCGQASTHRVALPRADGTSLLVGYCDECAEHQAGTASRVLALTLASLLLGVVSAASFPLLLPRLGLFEMVYGAAGLALLPVLLLFLPLARRTPPHAARGLAVFWGKGDQLLCARAHYGARIVELNRGELQNANLRERFGWAWLCLGPILAAFAACLAFFVYHPLLRVINLGPVRAEVALDGHPLTSVEPSSNESVAAGARVRVPAGQHTLSVTSRGGLPLARVEANFHTGAVHLLAIAADDTCFWLETTGYGREQRAAPSYEALVSPEHFWSLPDGIDTWFAENPGSSNPNSRSSGGLVTALRQAPCADAPPEVRAANPTRGVPTPDRSRR